MRRFPAGVAVITVDLDGERLGQRSARSSRSLDPPLVGFAVKQQAALHELLRRAGDFGVSLLAAGQEHRAAFRARVPPIGLWRGVELLDPARLAGAVGWLRGRVLAEHPAGTHTFFVGEIGSADPGLRPAAGLFRTRLPQPVIEAVVFDLDGLLLDTEQVWDQVREELVRERGGRWHDRAQADMMGMSSTEWSRYLHEELGLAEPPEELNRLVVERMEERFRRQLPLVDGAVEAVRRLADRWPLGLASSSNRPLIDLALELMGIAELFRATVSSGESTAKPAPDVYLEAARRLEVEAEERRRRRGFSQRDPLGEGEAWP